MKDNSTGKNKDFYDLGKRMFDRIPPITQGIPQIPQEHSSKVDNMKEEWLLNGAVVPVDVETTSALVAEIHRLIGVVGGMALAKPERKFDPNDSFERNEAAAALVREFMKNH